MMKNEIKVRKKSEKLGHYVCHLATTDFLLITNSVLAMLERG